MQCTDVIRMDPPLEMGVVMISTYPTTLETTEALPPDAVARTRYPQGTQLVTVVFSQGGLISIQRTSKYSMKQVIKRNIPFKHKYFVENYVDGVRIAYVFAISKERVSL